MITNQPKVIYLNTRTEDDENYDFDDLSEVSWCAEKTHEQDIKYVNAEEVVNVLDSLIKNNFGFGEEDGGSVSDLIDAWSEARNMLIELKTQQE